MRVSILSLELDFGPRRHNLHEILERRLLYGGLSRLVRRQERECSSEPMAESELWHEARGHGSLPQRADRSHLELDRTYAQNVWQQNRFLG